MANYVLTPEVTVELIRAMRAIDHSPTPQYIADLAATVGEICSDMEPELDGRFFLEIVSPPLVISFSLGEEDLYDVPDREDLVWQRQRREKSKSVFDMLNHDVETPTIADKGRIQIRVASPREISDEGLAIWNEYVADIQAGNLVLADLKTKLRNYVVDVEEQVGYRISFERITPFSKGEVAVPALANKKLLLVNFHLLTIDGEPIAIPEEATARALYLDETGRADPKIYEDMFQRTMDRAFSGQKVFQAADKTDKIKNADLLARNKPFEAKDYPLFFDDLIRFEVLGEKVLRCRRALPRC